MVRYGTGKYFSLLREPAKERVKSTTKSVADIRRISYILRTQIFVGAYCSDNQLKTKQNGGIMECTADSLPTREAKSLFFFVISFFSQ